MKRISLLILLITFACTSALPRTTILDSSPCQIPCWNEITPGYTTQDKALEITKSISNRSANLFSQPWKIFEEYVRFSFDLNDKEIQGEIYFIDKKVNTLVLSGETGLTIGDMVNEIGNPENIVSISFDGGGPILIAIYPQKGVEFEMFARSENLKQEASISNLMFFDITYYESLLENGMFSMGTYDATETKKIMYTWKGYGKIKELYPPRLP